MCSFHVFTENGKTAGGAFVSTGWWPTLLFAVAVWPRSQGNVVSVWAPKMHWLLKKKQTNRFFVFFSSTSSFIKSVFHFSLIKTSESNLDSWKVPLCFYPDAHSTSRMVPSGLRTVLFCDCMYVCARLLRVSTSLFCWQVYALDGTVHSAASQRGWSLIITSQHCCFSYDALSNSLRELQPDPSPTPSKPTGVTHSELAKVSHGDTAPCERLSKGFTQVPNEHPFAQCQTV